MDGDGLVALLVLLRDWRGEMSIVGMVMVVVYGRCDSIHGNGQWQWIV